MTRLRTLMVSPLLLVALATSVVACGGASSSTEETSDDALRETTLPLGTYVVDGKPSASLYLARLTLISATDYEADLMQDGATRFSRGKYTLFAAQPNDPRSPVSTDKPWIALQADSGPSPNFEFDRLAGGGLTMYASARHQTFAMKKDPSWRAPATSAKTITCTGSSASAKLVLDVAENRGGTLDLKGTDDGSRHPVPTATVSMTLVPVRQTGAPDWVRYEGTRGQQDFSFGIKKGDFDRGAGEVYVSANFAEGGQAFDIGLQRCSF